LNIHKPHIQKHAAQASEVGDTKKYVPKKYRDFAEGMEAQFAEYMVKQMKKSISGETKNSPASSYYDDLMTKEYTKQLTQSNGGMGIQDLILDDVYPKKFRNKEALAAYKNEMKKKSMRPQSPYEMHGPSKAYSNVQIKDEDAINIGVSQNNGVTNE